jgi:tryptophanyl-tRNA synthetase
MTAQFAGYAARRAELLAAPERVQAILEQGAAKARAIAQRTMAEVHKKLGLWRSR